MILMIDNYDSFTYNLYQYFGQIYPDIEVYRNDEITIEEIEKKNPDAIVISPGPGYPADAGISVDVIKHFGKKLPILGICLGHQAIATAFGGKIIKARQLMHGKSSIIKIDDSSKIFSGLGETIRAGRYHSLIVYEETLPKELKITARDESGQIMALEHKNLPIYGIQFHPESILTENGMKIIENFINIVKGAKKMAELNFDLNKYSQKVIDRKDLSFKESQEAMDIIMSGKATSAQMAELLTALRIKGETPDEIAGFAKGMRDKAIHVPGEKDALEIVGTGGDLAYSFNISTTSAFVISASGAKVAKHGNRSISSKSGAADVLEALGVKIQSEPEQAKKALDTIGIYFLFAQSYHKSMKYVGPTRKEMGIRTVFNILGPLTNPAETDYIVLGTYTKDLLPVLANVLMKLGIKHALVIFGNDTLDEASISDSTSVCEVKDNNITQYEIKPEDFGLGRYSKSDIVGGTAEENAKITKGILKGEIKGAKRDIVLLNSGCGLYTIGKTDSIAEGVKLAAELIDSGKAYKKLEELIEFSNK